MGGTFTGSFLFFISKEEIIMQNKVYEIVVNKIELRLEDALKNGTKFYWKKPWSGTGCPYAQNYITQKRYSGINYLLLPEGEYITFKQIQQLQLHNPNIKIKKGCHQETVYFFSFMEKEDSDGEVDKIPFLKFYKVFNIVDVEGIEPHFKTEEFTHTKTEDMLRADEIIEEFCKRDGLRMEVMKGSNKAFYRPSEHMIQIPDKSQFSSMYQYYQVLGHELSHACSKTLNRKLDTNMNSNSYSQEELCAEISSNLLMSEWKIYDDSSFGIENSISYIQHWLSKLDSENMGFIVKSANQATKCADLILNRSFSKSESDVA